MVSTLLTRNEDHFVRNHGGIPEINEEDYFFDVGGLVNNPRRITLQELKDENIFPRQSTVVTLQCSGTRRLEQIHEYPGDGDELINAPVRIMFTIYMNYLVQTDKDKLVGGGCYWHSSLDRCISKEGYQILWWPQIPRLAQ